MTPGRVVFALASCQYPGGLLDRTLARRSIDALAAVSGQGVPQVERPAFLIIAGDQIYVDATAGLFDPAVSDRSRAQAYGNVLKQLQPFILLGPSYYSMIDDHEIVDNWEPQAHTSPTYDDNRRLLDDAMKAYVANARRVGACMVGTYTPGDPLWYTLPEQDGHRFFFADTRTTRTLRNARTLDSAHIMSAQQATDLTTWLAAAQPGSASVVVSPSILLPRRLATSGDTLAALHSDAWDGYPASLHALLAWLCERGPRDVLFVSGDEHLSCAATVTLWRVDAPEHRYRFHSVHGSALYAPFPFANGHASQLAGTETFEFDAAIDGTHARFVCAVETFYPPAENGFALIALTPTEGALDLHVAFHACRTLPASVTHWKPSP